MAKAKKEEFTAKPEVAVTEVNKIHLYQEIFTIAEHNGDFLIAVSNKLMSAKRFKSLEEAQQYIDSKPWELIVNVPLAIFDIASKQIRKAGVAGVAERKK